jgi:hypothetical protein
VPSEKIVVEYSPSGQAKVDSGGCARLEEIPSS